MEKEELQKKTQEARKLVDWVRGVVSPRGHQGDAWYAQAYPSGIIICRIGGKRREYESLSEMRAGCYEIVAAWHEEQAAGIRMSAACLAALELEPTQAQAVLKTLI